MLSSMCFLVEVIIMNSGDKQRQQHPCCEILVKSDQHLLRKEFPILKNGTQGVPATAQWVRNQTIAAWVTTEAQVLSWTNAVGSKGPALSQVQHRLLYSWDSVPGLGTSKCVGCGH